MGLQKLFPKRSPGGATRFPLTEMSNGVISPDETAKAIKAASKGEAPGPSGLGSTVLLQIAEMGASKGKPAVVNAITEMIQKMFANSLSPDEKRSLLAMRIVPIPKPPK